MRNLYLTQRHSLQSYTYWRMLPSDKMYALHKPNSTHFPYTRLVLQFLDNNSYKHEQIPAVFQILSKCLGFKFKELLISKNFSARHIFAILVSWSYNPIKLIS
jgi:hypothetical protein